MSLLLGKAIYEILSGDTVVSGYVGDKISPIFTKELTKTPFIVYDRSNIDTQYSGKDVGVVYDIVTMTININDKDYNTNLEISNAVRNALELISGSFVNDTVTIYSSVFDGADEGFYEDNYITALDFKIKCK